MNNRYFCLDYARNLNDLVGRGGTWRNTGCGTTANFIVVSNLACGTTYYARVWTSAGGGLYSGVVSVVTRSAAQRRAARTPRRPPTGLNVIFTTTSKARLDWTPGKDNRWFCVDTARSRSDLLNLAGTWRNHVCWTTSDQVTITGLRCETLYYWRVYSWNRLTNAHSDIATFTTDDCDTKQVEAPIEDVDVSKVGSDYVAKIVVGRPSACYSFGSYTSSTQGNVIELTIYNRLEPGSCAAAYTTYTLSINLGSGYFKGVTYIVIVNDDESDVFTAN